MEQSHFTRYEWGEGDTDDEHVVLLYTGAAVKGRALVSVSDKQELSTLAKVGCHLHLHRHLPNISIRRAAARPALLCEENR